MTSVSFPWNHAILLFLSISFQWLPVTLETNARVVVMAESQRRCLGSELPARPVLPDFVSYPFWYSSTTLASLLFFERYQVCSHFRTSALLLGMLSSRYLYRSPSLQSGVYPAVSSCPDFPIQNKILFPVYFFIILIISWCSFVHSSRVREGISFICFVHCCIFISFAWQNLNLKGIQSFLWFVEW